jgi:hypothetical protein
MYPHAFTKALELLELHYCLVTNASALRASQPGPDACNADHHQIGAGVPLLARQHICQVRQDEVINWTKVRSTGVWGGVGSTWRPLRAVSRGTAQLDTPCATVVRNQCPQVADRNSTFDASNRNLIKRQRILIFCSVFLSVLCNLSAS